MESVLKLEKSLWWKRFVKEVGFELGVKEGRVMVRESGEMTEQEDLGGAGKGKSAIEQMQ